MPAGSNFPPDNQAGSRQALSGSAMVQADLARMPISSPRRRQCSGSEPDDPLTAWRRSAI